MYFDFVACAGETVICPGHERSGAVAVALNTKMLSFDHSIDHALILVAFSVSASHQATIKFHRNADHRFHQTPENRQDMRLSIQKERRNAETMKGPDSDEGD
jgi:hypothetical protein